MKSNDIYKVSKDNDPYPLNEKCENYCLYSGGYFHNE